MRRSRFFLVVALVGLLGVAALPPRDLLAKRDALEAAVKAGDHLRVVTLASGLVEVQPDDPYLWYHLGRSAFALDRHELSIEASTRAWDLGFRFMPWIALRIARSAAVLERDDAVFTWLDRSLDRGLEDRGRLADFEELARFREHPRFRALAGLDEPEGRIPGLRGDVDHLVSEARRLHPEYPRLAPGFEAAAEDLKRRIPELSDDQLLFDTMRLVARLEDGHSVVYGPREDSPLEVTDGMLPVLFYLFEEGLFVVDASEEASGLIGRRVLRIGDRTPEELLDYSRTLRGADNPMTMRWLGPRFYFPGAGFLIDAGAIEDPGRVALETVGSGGELETVGSGGEKETVVVTTGDHEFPRKLRPPKFGDAETPLYLRRVDTSYWFEVLSEHRSLYFQFNQVRDADDEPIAEFADRLGEVLADQEIESLIVDLRHNNGGNNGLLRPLVRQIVAFDTRPGTQVFVFIGRNTFSAAQNFVNRLDRWTEAVFVGEPSSSSPNFVGEETEVILPWSRILVSVSSRYWQDSDPGDDRPWVAPDLPVPPRADDYFAGRDAALEAVFDVISREAEEKGRESSGEREAAVP